MYLHEFNNDPENLTSCSLLAKQYFLQEYFNSIEATTLQGHLKSRRGVFGYTLLHDAVSGNKPRMIEFLKEKGANINAKDMSGYTPLHLAISAGFTECVKVMLRLGADISALDDYGKTPKQTAELGRNTRIMRLLRSEGKIQNGFKLQYVICDCIIISS